MKRLVIALLALAPLVGVALALGLRPVRAPVRRDPIPATPDVFIFVIDALRADHVSCYGYRRPTTPNLDAFARDAVICGNAHTPSTWTRPAVASLLTGISPLRHQVLTHSSALPHSIPALPAMLRARGYHTIAVQTNANAGPRFGFQQSFDVFRFRNCGTAAWANQQVRSLLTDSPTLAYVHIIEPHSPYTPSARAGKLFDSGARGACDGTNQSLANTGRMWPRLTPQDIRHLVDLYDGEIWDADRALGDFLSLLKRTGRYEQSLIIVTADHGEAFAEHNTLEHGRTLNAEEMRIPLIVRFPRGRGAGRRIEVPATLLDILPTILVETGIQPDPLLPGWDLGAMVDRRCPPRSIYAYVCADNPDERALLGLLDGQGYKRVMDVSRDHWGPQEAVGLWNARSDPGEQDNLSDDERDRALASTRMLRAWASAERAGAAAPQRAPLSPETRGQLRALGYLR